MRQEGEARIAQELLNKITTRDEIIANLTKLVAEKEAIIEGLQSALEWRNKDAHYDSLMRGQGNAEGYINRSEAIPSNGIN